jgi:hypothetical protein
VSAPRVVRIERLVLRGAPLPAERAEALRARVARAAAREVESRLAAGPWPARAARVDVVRVRAGTADARLDGTVARAVARAVSEALRGTGG